MCDVLKDLLHLYSRWRDSHWCNCSHETGARDAGIGPCRPLEPTRMLWILARGMVPCCNNNYCYHPFCAPDSVFATMYSIYPIPLHQTIMYHFSVHNNFIWNMSLWRKECTSYIICYILHTATIQNSCVLPCWEFIVLSVLEHAHWWYWFLL